MDWWSNFYKTNKYISINLLMSLFLFVVLMVAFGYIIRLNQAVEKIQYILLKQSEVLFDISAENSDDIYPLTDVDTSEKILVFCNGYKQKKFYNAFLLHGMTKSQVVDEFSRSKYNLIYPNAFGWTPTLLNTEYTVVSEKYILSKAICAILNENINLLFTYEVSGIYPLRNINWVLKSASHPYQNLRYFQIQNPRQIYFDESISVKFFLRCDERDPYVNMASDAYVYTEEFITGHSFWEDFIVLMFKHTNIRIWDFWLEDSKLYVDLHSTEAIFFNQGSTGSADRGNRLLKTLASLPMIDSFEILVGGIHGYETSHYNFAWIALIEDGSIIEFIEY